MISFVGDFRILTVDVYQAFLLIISSSLSRDICFCILKYADDEDSGLLIGAENVVLVNSRSKQIKRKFLTSGCGGLKVMEFLRKLNYFFQHDLI